MPLVIDKYDKNSIYQIIILFFVSVVLITTLAVILSWILNTNPITGIMAFWTPMKMNTAICLFLSGISIIFASFNINRISSFLSIFVIIFAGLTLSQYVFAINLHIDEALVKDFIETNPQNYPGRMAPNTSLCLILLNLPLLIRNFFKVSDILFLSKAMLIGLTILFSILAIISYFVEIIFIYGWGNIARMAVHTALSFILLSIAVLFLLHTDKLNAVEDFVISKLAILSFISLVILSIIYWQVITLKEKNNLTNHTNIVAGELFNLINRAILFQQSFLLNLYNQINTTKDIKYTKNLLSEYSRFEGFIWIDVKNNAQQFFIEEEKYKNLLTKIDLTSDNKELYVLSPKDLDGIIDSNQLLLVQPIFDGAEKEGYILGILNLNNLFGMVISPSIREEYNFIIQNQDTGFIYDSNINSNHIFFPALIRTVKEFYIGKEKYTINFSPSAQLINIYISWLPNIILFVGLFFAFLVALILQLIFNIKNNKKFIDLIFDNAGEGIIGLDDYGYISFINPTACKLLGYVPEDFPINLKNKTHHHIFHSRTIKSESTCPINICLETRKDIYVEDGMFSRKDGNSFNVEYDIRYIKNTNKSLGAVITFKDISYKKQIENQIRQKSTELERSNKELEGFSYSVSHDLRAPLRHIVGFIELIKKNNNVALDEQNTKYFGIILEAAKKMGNLIDDLLNFSRIGRFELKKEEFSLRDLALEVKAQILHDKELKKAKNIQINVNKLPYIYADKNMLFFVLQNLLSNAIKFTSTLDLAIINIDYTEDEEFYTITVSDNGIGFEQQYADKIFGVFERLHKSSEFPGTGIGLSNVKKIVERHNGKVFANSAVNVGTQVSFTIPKYQSEVSSKYGT